MHSWELPARRVETAHQSVHPTSVCGVVGSDRAGALEEPCPGLAACTVLTATPALERQQS